MRAIHTLSPTVLPSRFELANGEAVLRRVVHADIHRFSIQRTTDDRGKLFHKSRAELPLLDGQTNVRDMLLRSRYQAATREIVLRRAVRIAESSANSIDLLCQEADRFSGDGNPSEDRTQHLTLRLRFGFPGRHVACPRASFACGGCGDFVAGNDRRVCRVPRGAGRERVAAASRAAAEDRPLRRRSSPAG